MLSPPDLEAIAERGRYLSSPIGFTTILKLVTFTVAVELI